MSGERAAADAPPWSIAAVAQDIVSLIGSMAGQVLWAPGRPLWALALAQRPGYGVVCIDGGLALAHWYWPHHVVSGAAYPLDTLVRQVAARTRLVRDPSGRIAFPCMLSGAVCGTCCVMADLSDSPMLIPDHARIAGEPARAWVAPKAAAPPPPERTPDWSDATGPPAASIDALFQRFQVTPELALLPGSVRQQALGDALRRLVGRELQRQAMFAQPAPDWTRDQTATSRAITEAAAALNARLGEPAPAATAPRPPEVPTTGRTRAQNPADVY